MSDEVLTFNPNRERPELRIERRKTDHSDGFCRHHKKRLDPRARDLYCRDCGESIDPIAYLAQLAREWDALWWISRAEPDLLDAILYIVVEKRGRLSITSGKGVQASIPLPDGKRATHSGQHIGRGSSVRARAATGIGEKIIMAASQLAFRAGDDGWRRKKKETDDA